MKYYEFLNNKYQDSNRYGFEPKFIPEMAFNFQEKLIDWSVRKKR